MLDHPLAWCDMALKFLFSDKGLSSCEIKGSGRIYYQNCGEQSVKVYGFIYGITLSSAARFCSSWGLPHGHGDVPRKG